MKIRSEQKRKVCVVVNSRANYGRIKSALRAIRNHEKVDLQLIVGASALLYRFGRVLDLIEADGFEVSATLYSIVEGETPVTMAKSTGLAVIELATLFENLKPDIVLTVADRFETLATAVAASYMNIPLAHTQGGEVTGSIDESVRHAITKLAHIHFPATKTAARTLELMGEDPEMIFNVGCPAIDEIAELDLTMPEEFFQRRSGVGAEISTSEPYLVVLQHPNTTEYGDGLTQVNETLAAIKKLNLQTVWLWPNVDAGSDDISKGLRVFREQNPESRIRFFRNFAVDDYARLIYNSACLVGNSSSGLREGAYLGVPTVNIGSRQQNRETAENVAHSSHERSEIEGAILQQIAHGRYPRSNMFGEGGAGIKIASILANVHVKIQKTLHYGSSRSSN